MEHLLATYQDYATAIQLTLGLLPWERVELMLQILHQARMQQQMVFVMGSGMDAAAASHLAYELDTQSGGQTPAEPPLRAMALIDASPPFAVWGDTRSYDSTFARLIHRIHPGDVVIALSTRGTSAEVLGALRQARAYGGYTIGLGSDQDRRLADAVDLAVLVPNDAPDQIEDICQIVVHIVAKALRSYAGEGRSIRKRQWRVAAAGHAPYPTPLILIERRRRSRH